MTSIPVAVTANRNAEVLARLRWKFTAAGAAVKCDIAFGGTSCLSRDFVDESGDVEDRGIDHRGTVAFKDVHARSCFFSAGIEIRRALKDGIHEARLRLLQVSVVLWARLILAARHAPASTGPKRDGLTGPTLAASLDRLGGGVLQNTPDGEWFPMDLGARPTVTIKRGPVARPQSVGR